MRHKLLWAMLTAVVLVGIIALAGCAKKQQTELQGAPSASAPSANAPAPAAPAETAPAPTHTMPGGQVMTNEQMKGMEGAEGKKAEPAKASATAAKNEMATCPVLGTTMSKDKMIPYEYKGKTYYFCCPPCVEKFKKSPEKYIKNPAPAKPAGEGMGG
jgi:YHS domain-containing protein